MAEPKSLALLPLTYIRYDSELRKAFVNARNMYRLFKLDSEECYTEPCIGTAFLDDYWNATTLKQFRLDDLMCIATLDHVLVENFHGDDEESQVPLVKYIRASATLRQETVNKVNQWSKDNAQNLAEIDELMANSAIADQEMDKVLGRRNLLGLRELIADILDY